MNRKYVYNPSVMGSLRQGEILSNVTQLVPVLADFENKGNVEEIDHSFCIVVTQDCDLDWDFREKIAEDKQNANSIKILNSIILCELKTAHEIRRRVNSSGWNEIRKNNDERYYFLEGISPECDYEAKGVPELTSDFKRVFSLESNYLYFQLRKKTALRRATLNSPYLEHFTHRFHGYHGRVALPFQYQSEKARQP